MIFYIALDVNEKKQNVEFSSNKTSFVKKQKKQWLKVDVVWQSEFIKDILTAKKTLGPADSMKKRLVIKHLLFFRSAVVSIIISVYIKFWSCEK